MNLSTSQFNFLALHVKNLAEHWKWYFGNTQLRARAGNTTATIWRDDLDDLIARGLMFKGAGCADVHATIEGRALILMALCGIVIRSNTRSPTGCMVQPSTQKVTRYEVRAKDDA